MGASGPSHAGTLLSAALTPELTEEFARALASPSEPKLLVLFASLGRKLGSGAVEVEPERRAALHALGYRAH
jgi:hypothetical protein